ncbi:MAG: hypothetical protein Q4C64_08220 [Erysipelotrichia bacterium]|nr:hypothetical protein [Erysipelotrichia bacterium]
MTKKELEKEITKKVKEIKKLNLMREIADRARELKKVYYDAYPEGDYLTITFFKKSIQFNNSSEDDKEYHIDYYEGEVNEDESL